MHLPPTEHLPDVAGGSPNAPAPRHPDPDPHDVRFEEEIDLGRYLRPLKKHWMLVAAACVVGAMVGLLISARRPTLYEASTTVLVQQATSGEAFSTARALLRNYTLAAETIQELGLNAAPYSLTPQRFVEQVLVVEESGGTHLLNVKVRLADPAFAAKASHLLSTKAVQLNRRVASEGSTAIRDQLKGLLDDASKRLDTAEQELLAERSRARLEVAKKDAEVMLDGRAELQDLAAQLESEKGRLAAAEEELKHHQPLLANARSPAAEEALQRAAIPPADPVPSQRTPAQDPRRGAQEPRTGTENAPSSPGDTRTRPSQGGEKSVAGAQAPERPKVGGDRGVPSKALAEPMADPRMLDLSNPFVNPVYQTLQFQIAMSRARIAGLERERRQMMNASGSAREMSQLYRSELAVARLETNYALAQRVYSDLSVRYEQSRAESVGNMVQLQIVDPAMPPDRPMPRKRTESALLGFAGGFFLAALLAIFATPAEADASGAPRRS